MSLIKQLWIGILVMLLLALGGSFFISLVSAKTYLQEQLQVKNMDNAASLALSMSQLDKDPVTLELLISAQFDTGHYRRITLTSPGGELLIAKQASDAHPASLPDWFVRLAGIEVKPGIAQVQDGWQQFGMLVVESRADFAITSLWKNAARLLQWFLILALGSGLLGTLFLKYISRPLDIAVQQAEAIGNRRFITSREPRTYEFRRLVRAMNTLSGSVRVMLEKETRQLEVLRRESQLDNVTGLYNRDHFFSLLDSQLSREDNSSEGMILLIRIINLTEINNRLGRGKTDEILRQLAEALKTWMAEQEHSFCGRLNGSDIALVVADAPAREITGEQLSAWLRKASQENNLHLLALPMAWGIYQSGEERNSLMHRLDGALAQAEARGNRAVISLTELPHNHQRRNVNEWRHLLVDALENHKIQLARFPVKTLTGAPLHYEAPARLHLDEALQPAGYFVPWASRLGLMPSLDLAVIHKALETIDEADVPLAINISIDAVKDSDFREKALNLLTRHSNKCRWLWLEFPEATAIRCPGELRHFSAALRQLGCHVGLDHAGMEFTRIEELQNIGLDYLKIDGSLIRSIDNNPGNQALVKGMTAIGHSLGMVVIAEDVHQEAEIVELSRLGLDGITGPGVQGGKPPCR